MKRKIRVIVPLAVLGLFIGGASLLLFRDIPAPVTKVEKALDPAALLK